MTQDNIKIKLSLYPVLVGILGSSLHPNRRLGHSPEEIRNNTSGLHWRLQCSSEKFATEDPLAPELDVDLPGNGTILTGRGMMKVYEVFLVKAIVGKISRCFTQYSTERILTVSSIFWC
jgi:hypothetical protein